MRIFNRFKRMSKIEIALHCVVSLFFFLVAASYTYILVWAGLAGLKTHTEVVMQPYALPTVWHWENYITVFKELNVNGWNFFGMLFNSVWFSVLGGFLSVFVTMNFAYCCTKYKFPGSELPYTIILIMLTLPIYGSSGAYYKIIHSLGLIDNYAYVLVSGCTGFTMEFLYFRACFKGMSWSYAEAAMIDGANEYDIYFRVMAPMAKPLFGALYLRTWLTGWNDYSSGLVYMPNKPLLPTGIYQFNTEMLYRARLDILFAACLLVAIPALVMFIIFNKTLTTSVSIGGIKG